MSDKSNVVKVTKEAVAGPSEDYLYVGKVTMQRYFNSHETREIELAPYSKTFCV